MDLMNLLKNDQEESDDVDETTQMVFEIIQKVLDSKESETDLMYKKLPTVTTNPNNGMMITNQIGAIMGQQKMSFININHYQFNFWTKNSENVEISSFARDNSYKQYQDIAKKSEFQDYYNRNYIRFPRKKFCKFCKKNGESLEFCSTHSLYEKGVLSCPVLQRCRCTTCGRKGHTLSHCPLNKDHSSIFTRMQHWNMMK